MGQKARERKRRRDNERLDEAETRGRRMGEESMQDQVEALEAQSRIALRQMTKERREQERMDWHNSPLSCGYPLLATAAFLLVCVGAVPAEMLAQSVVWASHVADKHFTAMGGQKEKHFEQKRQQYQMPIRDENSPPMRILLWLKAMLFVAGYRIVRGAFLIKGGSMQFMHKDRGWWHSISVFVCLVRRCVRFGCPGRDDFTI